ncbi:hypothetical protein T484DRAFT_1621243, partial [Baffinella frigidus]
TRCLPGSYSATGLESCSKCGAGAYQPARSATGCPLNPTPPVEERFRVSGSGVRNG